MVFSKKLKELRIKKGFSKVTMAKKLDIPYTTYNNYENGREPKYEILREIAHILNVTLSELLEDDFNNYLGDMKNELLHSEKNIFRRFEDNLNAIDYALYSNEKDENILLSNGKDAIEITKNDIVDLIKEIDDYLLFKIEQLKKKNEDKKEYYK